MTAHKHADIGIAKLKNMELVVLRKNHDGSWGEIQCHDCLFMPDFEYFLCLPQYKNIVLSSLNGCEVEWLDAIDGWLPAYTESWSKDAWYMTDDDIKVRIKPRKEKRWIATKGDNIHFVFFDDCHDDWIHLGWKLQEIEIEV